MAAYGRHEVERRAWATSAEIRDRFPESRAREFLLRAVANARRAGIEERTGFPFGAVIVDRDGAVVADGRNHVFANFDPTAHAEVQAIRAACAALKVVELKGCILYSSSEPCPMCLAAAYWAGVDGVVFGASAADAAEINGFDDAFLYGQLAEPASARRLPTIGLSRDEAVAVLKAYDEQAREES
ncbi:nucleoside deaminase [Paludisphaera mucosa]|uniref:Nucleoside deaminase n=1 Tax=Paludisphaera mucosa TaxID=3030827 RepID=A0ABT6FB61_9BACT|nr:nucleoside deaminase [Paludisphaera mucosa]MDG3004812.1 nucleoside deaminase [Paludisphaera mucosa]